jgi:hypothetical protein
MASYTYKVSPRLVQVFKQYKGFASAVVLVLPMGEICEVAGSGWAHVVIYTPSFMMIGSGI